MFETVAAPRPVDQGRRAASFALSLLLNLTIFGALWALTRQVVEQVSSDEAPVRLTFLEALPVTPPGPPAPPARPRRAPAAPAAAPVAPPPEPTPTPAVETTELAGVQTDGLGANEGDPEAGGEGGEGEGPGAGGGGDAIRAVHWSEVKVKRRVEPRFPETAQALGLDGTRCPLHLVIDERGAPTDIDASRCHAVFRPSALEAAWQWRFYPMKVNGEPVPAAFDLVVVYRLR